MYAVTSTILPTPQRSLLFTLIRMESNINIIVRNM